MKTCDMTQWEESGGMDNYFRCNRKAKWKSPSDSMHKRGMYLCGIHKNSVDRILEIQGKKQRCKELTWLR